VPHAASVEIERGARVDVDPALALLHACGLPVGGFPDEIDALFVAKRATCLYGVAALERHGEFGLLRSVAVAPHARGNGIAGWLCTAAESYAREIGSRLFLLTETAQSFFEHRGYVAVERALAPQEIKASREFSELCPASAVLMALRAEWRVRDAPTKESKSAE
jgi:amino-acid N-acetyltransferase